jgi:hypothetical protein
MKMKKPWILVIGIAVTLLAFGTGLFAQEKAPLPRVFFGPVLGADAVIIDPAAFDASMQAVFPSASKYFPVFTEMGVESAQLFPMGDSKSSVVLHELFLLQGLDQNMPVPCVDLLLGYRTALGFEIGMGPHFSVIAPDGSVKIGASVMYWVGWGITSGTFSLPIKLTFVPLPSYANPKISLLVGFSFEGMPQ